MPRCQWCLGNFMEVIELATFPEARCQECWKTEICEIVGQDETCPFYEPLEKRP